MEFIKKDESKIVEVWMTNQEQKDEALQEKLKPIYKKYKEAGYLVAVFLSGNGSLREYTSALLQFNHRRAVERSLEVS